MPVRENTIHSPREEMSDLRKIIESERSLRDSLRISIRPEYYAAQKEYLTEQLNLIQGKLNALESNFQSGQDQIAASFDRTKIAKQRLAILTNREKITRMEKLQAEIEALKGS